MLFIAQHWVITMIFLIGIALSFISTILVLLALKSLKNFDFSSELRLFSTLIDISMASLMILNVFLESFLEVCLVSVLFIFCEILHGFWIVYMSYSMYQIICVQKHKQRNNAKTSFFLGCFLSVCISSVAMVDYRETACMGYQTLVTFYYLLFAIIIPECFILMFNIVCYCFIRQALKNQWKVCRKLGIRNRILFKRIYGYIIVYFMLTAANGLFAVQVIFEEYLVLIGTVRVILYAYYPFFNSVLYGLTKSMTKSLKCMIFKRESYNENQILLEEMRNEYFILPREFYDIIDFSEEQALE